VVAQGIPSLTLSTLERRVSQSSLTLFHSILARKPSWRFTQRAPRLRSALARGPGVFAPPWLTKPANCGPSGLEQITVNGISPANEDYVNARWDYTLSSSNTIFARYVFDNGSLSDPSTSTANLFPEQSQGRNQYITIGDKKNLFFEPDQRRPVYFHTDKHACVHDSGIPGAAILQLLRRKFAGRRCRHHGGPARIGPSNFTPDFEIQNTFALADDVFWTHGNHTFEIGMEFRRLQSPLANGFFTDQGWSFPSYASFVEGQAVNPSPNARRSPSLGRFRAKIILTGFFTNLICFRISRTPGKCRAQ